MRMLPKAIGRQVLGWQKHLWDRCQGSPWCWGLGSSDLSCWLFLLQTKLKHKLTVIYSQINGASRALEDVRARQHDVRVSDGALRLTSALGLGWFPSRSQEEIPVKTSRKLCPQERFFVDLN